MTELAVLLPFHDGQNYIEKGFLDEILEAVEAATPEITVVALDDASTDDTRQRLCARPRLTVLTHESNTHYAQSANDLLRYAHEELEPWASMLIDQDAVITADAIDRLWKTLHEDERIGIAQPLVRDFRDSIYSAGHRYNEYLVCHPITREQTITDRPIRRPSVTLLGTLIRDELIDEVGLLDERFGIYWESSDIGFRTRKHGWDVVLEPRAVARHDRYLSEMDHGELYYVYRNWPLFWAKFAPSTVRRIRNEYWPSPNGPAVRDVTENSDEPATADFLARAAADVDEQLGAFVQTIDIGVDEIPDDRVVVVRQSE